ncbi:MAG: DUF2190 family protein [Oscillospiraceae bacterium]|nr:DUF2190 family protein [Oscillospiraceae bacterium]
MATAKEAAKANVTAEYVQRGETLDYRNTTDAAIPCDTVITVGNRIGVTGGEIKPGELGALHMVGVFRIPKSGNDAIQMGAAVSFDGSGITATASEGATPAGYAATPSEASDKYVLVKLPG